MTAEAADRILDITRLAARIGRPSLTGIDRVERAYLREFLARREPLWLLLGGRRQALIPGAAGEDVLDWLDEPRRLRPATPGERLAEMRGGTPALAARRLRRLALAEGPGIARHLPRGGWYFNTGHCNASPDLFGALRATGCRVAILLHDTVPLDFPALSRPHAVSEMRAILAAANGADLVICNSAVTRDDSARHGVTARLIVAHLGTELTPADPATLPGDLAAALPPGRPMFLSVGTIEPRKNHRFLLDLWDHLSRQMPPADLPVLVIAGRRGWLCDPFFDRLARSPLRERAVFVRSGLPDGAVAALRDRARAMLMPSLAEGFGFPASEAAAAGVPVIVNDLPIWHETLANYPVYVPPGDLYSWAAKIQEYSGVDRAEPEAAGRQLGKVDVPGWKAHFNRVLSETC